METLSFVRSENTAYLMTPRKNRLINPKINMISILPKKPSGAGGFTLFIIKYNKFIIIKNAGSFHITVQARVRFEPIVNSEDFRKSLIETHPYYI